MSSRVVVIDRETAEIARAAINEQLRNTLDPREACTLIEAAAKLYVGLFDSGQQGKAPKPIHDEELATMVWLRSEIGGIG